MNSPRSEWKYSMNNQKMGYRTIWQVLVSHRQTFFKIISNCLNLVTENFEHSSGQKILKMFCWQWCSAMPCHQLICDAKKLLGVWAFCNYSTVICTFCIVNNCCYSLFGWVINFFVDSHTIRGPASCHLAMTDFCSSKCFTKIVVPWGTFLVRDLTIVHRSMFVQFWT